MLCFNNFNPVSVALQFATSTTIQQDRLRKVRDMEKQRSCMVAKLPNKTCVIRCDTPEVIDVESVNKTYPTSITKKRAKHVISKKSPVKKLSKLVKVENINILQLFSQTS